MKNSMYGFLRLGSMLIPFAILWSQYSLPVQSAKLGGVKIAESEIRSNLDGATQLLQDQKPCESPDFRCNVALSLEKHVDYSFLHGDIESREQFLELGAFPINLFVVGRVSRLACHSESKGPVIPLARGQEDPTAGCGAIGAAFLAVREKNAFPGLYAHEIGHAVGREHRGAQATTPACVIMKENLKGAEHSFSEEECRAFETAALTFTNKTKPLPNRILLVYDNPARYNTQPESFVADILKLTSFASLETVSTQKFLAKLDSLPTGASPIHDYSAAIILEADPKLSEDQAQNLTSWFRDSRSLLLVGGALASQLPSLDPIQASVTKLPPPANETFFGNFEVLKTRSFFNRSQKKLTFAVEGPLPRNFLYADTFSNEESENVHIDAKLTSKENDLSYRAIWHRKVGTSRIAYALLKGEQALLNPVELRPAWTGTIAWLLHLLRY
jgi:hypothetical protein